MKTSDRPHGIEAVVQQYMRDVDRSLLRRNLALSHQARLEQLQELASFAEELQRAGKAARKPVS